MGGGPCAARKKGKTKGVGQRGERQTRPQNSILWWGNNKGLGLCPRGENGEGKTAWSHRNGKINLFRLIMETEYVKHNPTKEKSN